MQKSIFGKTMQKNKKIGVFIPGRIKSERLPDKLILPLGESSLWEMACRKLNDLPKKYNKYALCYDKELVDIAKKYPNVKVILRDPETANVDGPLKFIFKELDGVQDTHLMFLNPCLSLLRKETILAALDQFEQIEADYATSVKPFKNWLFDNNASPLTEINYQRLTTKEIEGYWQAAHAFHIFNKQNFFKDGFMLKEGHDIIIINSQEELMDVDTLEDYEYAKFKLRKRYVVDIDSTICSHSYPNYHLAEPFKDRIKKLNQLYDAGNEIIFFTARGDKTKIDFRPLTEKQLKEWGAKYHELKMGKPYGHVYIDDKAISDKDFFK
jgi:CMP-N-acetylneuraminic acid synthetase